MLKLDHIVISSESLDDGQAFIEDRLGIKAETGGEHRLFGTHNKLISLGASYLEVISISPDLIAERTPRWFNLDNFTGYPRITNWVCSADFSSFVPHDLMPEIGDILDLSRGSLRWNLTVPKNDSCSAIFPSFTLTNCPIYEMMFSGTLSMHITSST